MPDKLIEVLNQYKATATSMSLDSELETNTEFSSPLQIVVRGLIDRAVPRPLMGMAKRILPDLATFIGQIDDPDLLHEQISQVYSILGEVLKKDHDAGYGGQDRCQCFSPGDAESVAVVPSRADGNGQEHTIGSPDEGVSTRVLDRDS